MWRGLWSAQARPDFERDLDDLAAPRCGKSLRPAIIAFKLSPWILVAGLGGHAIFDLVHGYVVTHPGVPAYWPAFCLAVDVSLAAALEVLIRARPAS